MSTHIFDFYEAFASFFYCPLASIKCNCIVVICNCFVVDRLLYLFYNVYRDRSVHYAAERSDPVKKYNCLLALLVSVFLLLCACAQRQADQASSPDALSSAPSINVTPASRTPDSRPPATSKPATSKPATSAPATTVPVTTAPATTAPATSPAPPPTEPNLDWVTNREIVPFEDRFKEDVPFGYDHDSWLTPWTYPGYSHYLVEYRLMRSPTYFSNPIVIQEQGIEEDALLYWVPISLDRLDDMKTLSVDGRWGYFSNDSELCKLELLTGELTTLAKKNESDIFWEVQACGKDTVCIFQLDAQRNLRIYYRDLHSDAERTLYEGILPQSSPYDFDPVARDISRGIYFTAPSTTLGTFSWQMMNPAFYEAVQKELANPNSQFKHRHQQDYSKCWENPEEHPIHLNTYPPLCDNIEDAYNIPYYIKYTYDPVTGTLTEDYGIIDSCFYGTGENHNHFDYEITKEEVPVILDTTPVKIPNFSKRTGAEPFWGFDHCYTCLFSDFGHSSPYWRGEGFVHKLADIAVTEMSMSNEYIYCFTTEGTILQFNHDGSICNTIYTSENELYDLHCCGNNIYFIDDSTIICIDETAGTWRPVIQTTLKEIYISRGYDDGFKFGVRQGLYGQEYQFYLDTGELLAQSYS